MNRDSPMMMMMTPQTLEKMEFIMVTIPAGNDLIILIQTEKYTH